MPFFNVFEKPLTEYGGLETIISNTLFSLPASFLYKISLYLSLLKTAKPSAEITFASPSPFKKELTLDILTRR